MKLGNRSSLTTGEKAVGSAGTAEQLPDVKVPEGFEATITAKPTNTQRIYFGGSKAEAEAHTASLAADEVFHEALTNLNVIWIDAEVSGEGIDYVVPQ